MDPTTLLETHNTFTDFLLLLIGAVLGRVSRITIQFRENGNGRHK